MRAPRCPRGASHALLLSIALALLAAASAEAKKRVVVLPFSGPGSAGARNGVSRALGKKVTQIRPATYTSMAEDLGVDGSEPGGMVAVCSKIKCDAVIKGSVAKRGRKFTLTVTVLDGGTGEAIGKRAATVRGARKVAAAGAAIGAQCVALAAKGKFKPAGKPAPPKPPEPPPEPVAKPPVKPPEEPVAYKPPEPEEKPTKRRRKKKRSDDDEGSGDGDGEDEERVTKRASRRKYAGLFDVAASVGLAIRRAVVTVPVSSAASPPVDSTYDGGMYPEFTVRADLFPLVPFTKSFVRNVGLGVAYTRHLSISTKMQDPAAPPVETSSQELLLDLRLRWTFFKTVTSPEVNLFFGYGLRDFNLSENIVMASFNYRFLRVGLEGNIPLGTPYIGLFAGFDVRPLLGAGEAVQYLGTRDSGLGFAVRGGAMGRHSSGFFYFLSVEYLRFSTKFVGLAASPDINPADIGKDKRDRADPNEASDRFVRFWAGAGFMM